MPKRTHEAAMQTKRIILEAAHKLFSEKGFDKTSLSDIAREAGVTRGAIYWHFEDKGELLVELCKELAERHNLMDELERAADPDEIDPLGCLKRWMLMHASAESRIFFSSNLAQLVGSILANVDSRGGGELRERLLELVYMRNQLLSAAVRNAVNHHQLPVDLGIDLVCAYLCQLLVGFCNKEDIGYPIARPEEAFSRIIGFAFSQLHLLRRSQVLR